MTKNITRKTIYTTFSLLFSLYSLTLSLLTLCLLAISTYAYAVPIIETTDITQPEKVELNDCKNQEDITSLENYSEIFVVITPKGCLLSDTKFTINKVLLTLPVPISQTTVNEHIKNKNTQNPELKTIESSSENKQSGVLNLSTWWFFFTVAFVNIVSPGSGVLLTITTSLSCGFVRALYTTMGHLLAMFIASAIAVFGLGSILDSSSYVLIGFKFTAALYLIYLGVSQWKSKTNIFATLVSSTPLKVNKVSLFMNGLLVGILNPHTILFFTAFAPTILDSTKSLVLQFIVIASTYVLLSLFTMIGYAGAASSVKRWFTEPRRVLWFRRVSGAMFVTLGLAILRLKAGVL